MWVWEVVFFFGCTVLVALCQPSAAVCRIFSGGVKLLVAACGNVGSSSLTRD